MTRGRQKRERGGLQERSRVAMETDNEIGVTLRQFELTHLGPVLDQRSKETWNETLGLTTTSYTVATLLL